MVFLHYHLLGCFELNIAPAYKMFKRLTITKFKKNARGKRMGFAMGY
jgi:hypothetical protein